ncbi:hypothetical protein ONZ43_g7382 [Nemania bipapillata]|uniref:Uncharacterized protein n=1 Tax=Nemania bipapillata TaxID=110536 RepID=A0ACC2HSR8_9PEZI|nr:hypothetical protein ONZ43_g7382 [Nemania bipapillata]
MVDVLVMLVVEVPLSVVNGDGVGGPCDVDWDGSVPVAVPGVDDGEDNVEPAVGLDEVAEFPAPGAGPAPPPGQVDAPAALLVGKSIAEPREEARRYITTSTGLATAFLADRSVEGSRTRQVKAAADIVSRGVGVDVTDRVQPED